MEILSDLIICGVYTLACLHLGAIFLRVLGLNSGEDVPSALSLGSIAFLLGQIGLVVVWTFIGLLALFSPTLIRAVLFFSLLVGFWPAWPIYGSLIQSLLRNLKILYHLPIIWKVIALLIFTLIGINGVAAFVSPPVGDAEAFYLPFAKVMAASERLVPLPGYETFSQVGLFGELHFAALLALGHVESAKLFVWITVLAATTMLLGIGSQLGLKLRGQLLVLATLFTSSTFVLYISDGKVDLFAAALGLAAFFWALRFANTKKGSYIALIGIFTGMSIVAKISYLLAILPVIFLLVLWRYLATAPNVSIQDKLRSIIKLGLGMAFWIMLSILPHLIKNAVLFGQPFAPFIATNGTGNWLDQNWFSPEITRWILLTYPLSLVFGQYPMQGGGLSVLLLIFIPLILIAPKPQSLFDSKPFQLAISASVGIILWNILRASVFAPRYLLATLLVFIPVAVYLFEAYVQIESTPRWLSTAILFSVLIILCMNILERKDSLEAEVRAFDLKNEVSCLYLDCGVWKRVNKKAEPGARVFLAGYYRYWLRPDLLQCVSAGDEPDSFFKMSSANERWIYLFKRGFQYVIWDETTHSDINTALDLEQIPDWLNVNVLVREGANTLLYLESKNPLHVPDYSCKQIKPPAWDVVFNSQLP